MSERRRNVFVLALVAGLLIVSLIVSFGIPGVAKSLKTYLGLDLKGGVELIYKASPGPRSKVNSTSIEQSINIIRQRTNQYGLSNTLIQQSGSNEIDVSLPGNNLNASLAAREVGQTGQLYFYDWEANVIGPNGQPAGPNDSAVTGDGSNGGAAGASSYGITEYQAVLRAEKRPAQHFKLEAEPRGTYFYLDPKRQSVVAGPAQTRSDLLTLVAQTGKPLPKDAKLAFVRPGTVIVQSTDSNLQPAHTFFVMRDNAVLTGSDITSPQEQLDSQTNQPVVTFGFTGSGARAFAAVTRTIAQRGSANSLPGSPTFQHFAVTLDNNLITVPYIDFQQNPNGIDTAQGSEISGSFTVTSAQQLANTLASGALPLRLNLISSDQVSATLGHQALNQGLIAGLVGLLIVALFLAAFYRVLGLIAVAALVIYALYFYAMIKLIPVTLTLPGIAGLILTIGVAADANVVIFERVKEESRAGRSAASAIATGYKRGFAAILDANVITFMTAFILFMLSQADVKGFAFTLGIGTLVSLLTAVAATQAILGTMGRTRAVTGRHALGVRDRGHGWTFDFMGNSKWFFALSGTILLIGALAIGGRGINFGIDFVGGTRIQVELVKPATVGQVSAALASLHEKNLASPQVQKITNLDPKKRTQNTFQISSKALRSGEIGAPSTPHTVWYVLQHRFGVVGRDFNSTTIGPDFGKTIANSAVIAIIASLLVIAAYIALRFEWKYAVPVLIALMHDLLITAGVYALTGREVTSSTVAALLTILGYSLYDTIIVFDRVRENVARMQRAAFSQVVNRSMAEVLTRSLATSFCTLLPIVALLIFGGSTLKDFAFALLIGVASGAYSSIFIASPVLTHWKEREGVYRRRRERIAALHGGLVPAYAHAGEDAQELEPRGPQRRRRSGRLTTPERPDGSISRGEFQDLVRDLHVEPAPAPKPAAPLPDPKADALPEDVVMPDEAPRTPRPRGASKSRSSRRHGRNR